MTAKIKLNAASGGGSFSLQAPSSSSNNRVFTLPDAADGTIARTTDIAFVSYAFLADRHAGNAGDRGSYTAGDWRTREINTEVSDEDGIVTLSSNQFTLQAGRYFIRFAAFGYKTEYHVLRLRNITDTTTDGVAEACYNRATVETGSYPRGATRINISGAKVFEVQGQVGSTQNANGMGFSMQYGSTDFCTVEIFKEV